MNHPIDSHWSIPAQYVPSKEQTKEDLQAGLAYLREHGWCQGSDSTADGRVCAIGALTVPFRNAFPRWFDDPTMNGRFFTARWYLDAKVSRAGGPNYYTAEGYNDHVAKGVKDVEDLYEMAIADL